jgi:hypothetical protein
MCAKESSTPTRSLSFFLPSGVPWRSRNSPSSRSSGWTLTLLPPLLLLVQRSRKGHARFGKRTIPPASDGDATIIEDVVRYGLPFWPLGEIAHPIVRLQLGRIFRFRQSAARRRLLHRDAE